MNPQPIDPLTHCKRAQRLLWRIHQRYQTVTQSIQIGDLQIPFTRIADPNRVLDEVAEEEDRREKISGRRQTGDSLHLPYWAELWDSALGLGQYLVGEGARGKGRGASKKNPSVLAPCPSPLVPISTPSVLDLGCGMGLAGTAAAAMELHVLFVDLEAPALLFAQLNSLAYASRTRTRTRQLNWQKDRLDEKFDLILGADILYERAQWQFLEPFWRAHLRPGGSVLLGEPGRQTGDLFVNWITQQGWRLARHEEAIQTPPRVIRIFELTLTY